MIYAFTGHRNRRADPQSLAAAVPIDLADVWIQGGAEGFDAQVRETAEAVGVYCVTIRPDYKRFTAKAAPHVRNREIVDRGDVLIACWDGRQTGGTFRTIEYARKRGKTVVVLEALAAARVRIEEER